MMPALIGFVGGVNAGILLSDYLAGRKVTLHDVVIYAGAALLCVVAAAVA